MTYKELYDLRKQWDIHKTELECVIASMPGNDSWNDEDCKHIQQTVDFVENDVFGLLEKGAEE